MARLASRRPYIGAVLPGAVTPSEFCGVNGGRLASTDASLNSG